MRSRGSVVAALIDSAAGLIRWKPWRLKKQVSTGEVAYCVVFRHCSFPLGRSLLSAASVLWVLSVKMPTRLSCVLFLTRAST